MFWGLQGVWGHPVSRLSQELWLLPFSSWEQMSGRKPCLREEGGVPVEGQTGGPELLSKGS